MTPAQWKVEALGEIEVATKLLKDDAEMQVPFYLKLKFFSLPIFYPFTLVYNCQIKHVIACTCM